MDESTDLFWLMDRHVKKRTSGPTVILRVDIKLHIEPSLLWSFGVLHTYSLRLALEGTKRGVLRIFSC